MFNSLIIRIIKIFVLMILLIKIPASPNLLLFTSIDHLKDKL